ncbi:hypothetical protein ACFQU1_16540 [Chelatococcus sp. GCM10030263]|uniref:hypothetical protein n=1 Tax=Chelatococcus sp. GCM10030263 TaxID=3273387 RepID=UPI0036148594
MVKTLLSGFAATVALTAFIHSASAQTAQPQAPAAGQPSATAPTNPGTMGKRAATAHTSTKPSTAAKKPPSQAQLAARSRMKDCAAEWQKAKAAKTTGGKTYRQFSSACMKQH